MDNNTSYKTQAIDLNLLSMLDITKEGKVVSAEKWVELWNLVFQHINKIDAFCVDMQSTLDNWHESEIALNEIIEDMQMKYDALSTEFIHYGENTPENPHIMLWVRRMNDVSTHGFLTNEDVDSALSSTSENPVQNKVINTALGTKVDKVSGKGLSTNDYTSADKIKLYGIEAEANKTVVDTALSDTSENPVQNKVVNTALNNKMDKNNPTGTGSFSLNRRANTTVGSNSHAEGYNAEASGSASHAEGGNTKASGIASHAEGGNTKASGSASHAEGWNTIAASDYQHAQGKYNIEDSNNIYADIVGNGSSDTERSNAYTLDWNGNAWYAGNVYVGSTSGTNKDDGSKKLATEKVVLEAVSTEQARANNAFSNALKSSKSGEAFLIIDDVSPITHNMGVKLSSNTVTDLTAVKVRKSGKNLLPYPYFDSSKSSEGATITVNGDRSISFSGIPTSYVGFVLYKGNALVKSGTFTISVGNLTNVDTSLFIYDSSGATLYTIRTNKNITVNADDYPTAATWNISMSRSASNIEMDGTAYPQIELGSTATDDEPYIAPTEYTPNADGTVEGVLSLYPNTTLMTDTGGVIIDCEYNKDINIVLKHININTWKDVQDTVRAGFGHIRFPVGYEFTTEDSVTGAVITWVVRGHNHHAAANDKLKYTMTLEAKYVYGSASGTYKTLVFDAPEALYYAAEELPAGTYNFTLLAGYDTTYGGGKTLSFTLTKPVPAGGVIMFPWAYSKQSTVTKISTYASNAATAAIESVAVIEAADGTSLGTADGKSENVNHTHRIRYGSNNYAQSAARQWLNSDAAAGAVWAPSNIFDRPPFWNTSYSGFMRGLPVDFLAAVQPAIVPCRTNSIAEVNSLDGTEFVINQVYELQDKFFLLSRPEIYGTWDSSTYKDGELLEFYEGFTDTERIKYDEAGSARHCWLRSPQPGYANYEHLVSTSGALTNSYTNYAGGVAPACIIA